MRELLPDPARPATRSESPRFGGMAGYYQELPENKAVYVYTKAGQEPLPAPTPPTTPAVGANETLAALPNRRSR